MTKPSARSRSRTAASAIAALAAVSLLVPAAASAVTLPCECSAYGSAGLILVRSAAPQTRGVLAFSLAAHYYESRDLTACLDDARPGSYTSLHLAGNYGLTDWLELSFDLPTRRAAWDEGVEGSNPVTGLDNPVLGIKVGVPRWTPSFLLAFEGRFGFATGDELWVDSACEGRTYLTGGKNPDSEIMLLATGDFTASFPMRLHANIGWAFHGRDDHGRRFYPDYYPPVPDGGRGTDNDALILRGAVEFPGENVSLFMEFRGDIIQSRELVALKENALTVTPGLRVRFGDGWSATAGFGVAISGDDASTEFDPHNAYPDWELTVAVAYAWPVSAADTDGDGIPDYEDACHRLPEDFDGYQDDDGCPDLDNDGDGIPDALDGAPLQAEDLDGFEDGDGVPDLDNDGDGIVDERDMCPNEKEDLDGFEDEDGCPDR